MKTLLIMLLSVTLCLGLTAQRKAYYPVYHHVYRPRIYVAPYSYGFGYGYHYVGFPYGYNYGYRRMPYKLELQIEAITEDYQNRIKEARNDKSLSHSQRRQEIRHLKKERDQEIIDAKRDYSRPPRPNKANIPEENS